MTRPSSDASGVTMMDVAERAGVHQATVSRVLSKPELVNVDTRARVLDAIESLGYVPHSGARQMAGGRSGVIAAFVPDLANPFFASLLKSIQQAVGSIGSRVMVADTELDPAQEVELLRTFAPGIDAAVLCSPVASTAKLRSVVRDTPLVFVNRSASRVASVAVDQAEIVRLAVGHLRSLGHERIGVVVGPAGYWSTAQRRLAAQRFDDVVVFEDTPPTFDGGTRLVGAISEAGVTGILAFNDVMALGLVRAAAMANMAVPDDLSIVGSDDIAVAGMVTPALTTVAAPIGELARHAIARVEAALGGDTKAGHERLPATLVERSSTAPAPNRRVAPVRTRQRGGAQ